MAPPRAVPSVLHCRLQGARKESIREEVDGKFEGQVRTVVIPKIWSDGSYFYVGVYKTDDDDDDDDNNNINKEKNGIGIFFELGSIHVADYINNNNLKKLIEAANVSFHIKGPVIKLISKVEATYHFFLTDH